MLTKEDIESRFLAISHSERNTVGLPGEAAYDDPIVAYGDGDDPLFAFYKRDISPDEYRLPEEWLARKYGRAFDPGGITVISYALPQTERTRRSNRGEASYPSELWSRNRTFGERYNVALAGLIEEYLDESGVPAIAPMAHGEFRWVTSEKYGYASNWSERHTAFICGHGTFGLSDGLISRRGKAVRYGSVIAALRLAKTARDYAEPYEYCLSKQGCTGCVDRCPAGAITREGHDKNRCHDYQRDTIKGYAMDAYGFDGIYGCGLCQVGVPCEFSKP